MGQGNHSHTPRPAHDGGDRRRRDGRLAHADRSGPRRQAVAHPPSGSTRAISRLRAAISGFEVPERTPGCPTGQRNRFMISVVSVASEIVLSCLRSTQYAIASSWKYELHSSPDPGDDDERCPRSPPLARSALLE